MGKAFRRCTPTSVDPATTIEETTTVLTHPTLDQLNALGLQGMAPTHAARRMGTRARPSPNSTTATRPQVYVTPNG